MRLKHLGHFAVIILLLSVIQINCKNKNNSKCEKDNCDYKSVGEESRDYLGSKSPYQYKETKHYQYTPTGCTAVKFWYFGRHGTRNPGVKDITRMQAILPGLQEEIIRNYKDCRGILCKSEFKDLKSWKPRSGLTISKESHLVKEGKRELGSIGLRYQARFPNLFSETFDNSTFYFKFTKSQRTKASANAFVKAIFGDDEAKNVWFPEAQNADPVLKFYSTCSRWKTEVYTNPKAIAEYTEFTTSSTMNATILRVSKTLGLSRNLSVDEIDIMYTSCGFETAWKNKKGKLSPWCNLFDLEAMKVMSYREDLVYYWLDGPGYEINYKQACPLIRDAVEYFQKYVDDPSTSTEKKVQAYFSHSGGSLKMLARLGLFNDTVPLTSDNFEEIKDSYKWRSSRMDTMATNMAFVLYDCPSDDRRYQIGYFFQEIPTPLPACGGHWICSFDKFRTEMADIVNDCDMNEICGVSS